MLLNRKKSANCNLVGEIKDGFANNYKIDKMLLAENNGEEIFEIVKMSNINRCYTTSWKRLQKIPYNS